MAWRSTIILHAMLFSSALVALAANAPSVGGAPPALLSARARIAIPGMARDEGRRVTIAAVGDVMLGRSIGQVIEHDGPATIFADVRTSLAGADIAVANLECAVGDGGTPEPKAYTFLAPPGAVAALVDSGIDIVGLANNHALDFGPETLRREIALLDAAGMAHAGAGVDVRGARAPAILTRNGLRVAFIPNYRVSLAERIIPAADVSEQISTAGMEASGTGNMKFALNGALTLGTLDGANIEIREKVGAENFFLFGLTTDEVAQRKRDGYRGRTVYESNADVREVLDLISSGFFSPEDKSIFRPLVDGLLDDDRYMVLEDFDGYRKAQADIARMYQQPEKWWRAAILNVARTGWFSSDRTIKEYAADIWGIKSIAPAKGE